MGVVYSHNGISRAIIKDKKSLDVAKNEILGSEFNNKLIITLETEKYDAEFLSDVHAIADLAKGKGIDVEVQVDVANLEFKVSEMEQFIDMEDKCEKSDVKFSFAEGLSTYTLNETLSAQTRIDELVEKINKSNGSPFEKYLMAYNYVTTKIYKENEGDHSNSRNLVSVLNSDDIVCVGYARLMNRICRGIGIKSYSQESYVEQEGNLGEGHHNNLVYMKDDKYGIDGWFYSDACWDSQQKSNQQLKLLNRCLIPLSDKDKMKGCTIKINKNQKIANMPIACIYGDIDTSQYFSKPDMWNSIKSDLLDEDVKKIEADSNDRFLNDKRRSVVCKTLAEILKKENIPADIYTLAGKSSYAIPKECRYEYMLALLMQDNPDTQEISKCVVEIKKLANAKSSEENINGSQKSGLPVDIYKELQTLSETSSKKIEQRVKLKNGELVDIFSVDSNVDLSGIDELNFVDVEVLEIPKEWNTVLAYHKTDLGCNAVNGYAKNVKRGTPIPLKSFHDALKNNFLSRGMDETNANDVARHIVSTNVTVAKNIYNDEAENDFIKSALAKQQEQNLPQQY